MKKSIAAALLLLLLPLGTARSGTNDTLLSKVAVLTIHVSDTNTHDTIFRFLTDVLKLPIDYGPETLGQRRYAAVFAGNTFIEPCGPYSDMRYPLKNFKALFFGLNCTSAKSPADIAAALCRLNLAYEKPSPDTFRIHDASIAEGIYLALSSTDPKKPASEHDSSLQAAFATNSLTGLGLEYLKEIWLGYAQPANLKVWQEFLGDSGKLSDTLWRLDNHQSLRFVKSDFRGVRAIVCKVRSLKNAELYLKQAQCFGRSVDGRIELDLAKTCGLSIYVAEE